MSGLVLSSCLSRSSKSSSRLDSLLTISSSLRLGNVPQRISTPHGFIERRSKAIVKQGSRVCSRFGHGREPGDAAGIGKAFGKILVVSLGTAEVPKALAPALDHSTRLGGFLGRHVLIIPGNPQYQRTRNIYCTHCRK
jgi:hypothetical protein